MKPNIDKENNLSHDYLIKILDYNPDTGIFKWKIKRKQKNPGDVAGTLLSDGYIHIQIDGSKYKAHRLAWFYIHKKWPMNEINHKDHNRDNNAIDNLEECNSQYNNQRRQCKGYRKKDNMFEVYINDPKHPNSGKRIYRSAKTECDAIRIRQELFNEYYK